MHDLLHHPPACWLLSRYLLWGRKSTFTMLWYAARKTDLMSPSASSLSGGIADRCFHAAGLRRTGLSDIPALPLMNAVGIPPEITPLMILRPLSGSGGLAVGAELMAEHGADSTVGRIASVMLGSSETTFYTVAVYYGAAGILKTRYTIPAALIADLAAFLASVLAVHLFFGL